MRQNGLGQRAGTARGTVRVHAHAGDPFTFLTDTSQSGTVDTVNAPTLGGGLAFHVTYDPKDVTLGVS